MRKLLFNIGLPILLVVASLTGGLLLGGNPAAHAYSNSDMIEDSVFDNTNSMTTAQIQTFLNGFANSCIKNYSAPDPTGYFTFGGLVPASQVIKDASTIWGINPQVVMATMQKEEQLIDGSQGCASWKYWSAMGYRCPSSDPSTFSTYTSAQATASPDSYSGGLPADMQGSIGPTCVDKAYAVGFSAQVDEGAYQLEFARQRSEGNGNLNWDGDGNITYPGDMTAGCRARVQGGTVVCYDGSLTLSGQTFTVANGATASLYSYTPFLQSFDTIYSGWWGDPTTACESTTNVSGATSGFKILPYQYSPGAPTNLAFTIMNNTGTGCTEAHIWNPGFTSWLTHITTGMRATDPATGTLIASKSAVDNAESLNYILYSGGGGDVEIHRLSPGLQKFPGYYDVGTNLSGVTASTGMFVAGDFFGRGYDQLVYILYNGSTGHVEIHMFNPGMTKAVGYYDVATNLPSSVVSPSIGTFVAGDFLGKGYDQLAYVIYSNGTGHAEVHIFDPTLTKAVGYYDVASNLTGASATTGSFVAGDFLGRGYSQLVYVIDNDSSGMVETHMFNKALTQAVGFQDIITNLAGFNPAQ